MVVMCPNPRAPTDAGLIGRLLGEMRQYRGKHGIYAAEMLETARLLREQSVWHPRQAEAVSYCIRQAVVEIFGDTRDYTEPLENVVERAVAAKKNIQGVDIGEEDLQDIFKVVDELQERVCSPKPEARLKEIFRKDSWIEPEDGPHPLILDYRRIKVRSDKLLHHVSETPTDAGKVRDLYGEVVDTLALIFLPTERLTRIERLAELPAPQNSDLDELKRIMKNKYGFYYFASKMNSPVWFDLMDPDMLKSPSGNPPWLLRSLAGHLKDEHIGAFVDMLDKYFDRWVLDDVSLGELGFVGYMLGDNGLSWLVKTLQASKEVRTKRDEKVKARLDTDRPDPELIEEIERMNNSIWRLDNYILHAFLKIERPSSEFIELAEYLLSSAPVNTYYKTIAIPAKLVDTMDSSFSIQTIKILAKVLGTQRNLNWATSRPTSVARMKQNSPHKISNAVDGLHGALKKAGDLGIPTPKLVGALDTLPDTIKPRFVAWLYSRADDIGPSELADFVVDGCSSRPPTDDDDLLLDRLERDGSIGDGLAAQIRGIIGKAPEPAKMVGHPIQWNIDTEKLRRIMWARTMSSRIELPDEWKPCLDIMDGIYEAGRGSDGEQSQKALKTQDGTTLLGRYGTDVPLEAAAKIAAEEPVAGGLLNLMYGHSPVSDLETAVKNNVSGWVEDPVAIMQALHRPEYVAGYLRGLSGAEDALVSHADQIIFAVKFARDIRWNGGASSSTTFYHDYELTSVDMVGMMLIKKIIKNDIKLSKDSLAHVRSVVVDDIICPDLKTDAQPDFSTHFNTLYYKPHVQAVYTVLELIRYTRQNDMDIPGEALVRLAKTMRLTGQHGVDYHLCVGSEAGFIRQMVPEWFEQNEQYLFGSAASAELGRVALDTYLTEGQPDAFILEKYRDTVLDAVKRDDNALHYTLYCMLHGMRGYDPKYVSKSLMKIGPKFVSKTGWHMSKLLPEGVDADHVRRGIAFWDSVLKHNPKPKPEALTGFGWWADVPGIDQEQWEEMMMRTCKMVEKMEWSQRVAARISTSQTMTDTGWQILARLFSIDIGYEKEEVAEYSMEALRKTVDATGSSESRSHLCEVLVNHGVPDAAKYR